MYLPCTLYTRLLIHIGPFALVLNLNALRQSTPSKCILNAYYLLVWLIVCRFSRKVLFISFFHIVDGFRRFGWLLLLLLALLFIANHFWRVLTATGILFSSLTTQWAFGAYNVMQVATVENVRMQKYTQLHTFITQITHAKWFLIWAAFEKPKS